MKRYIFKITDSQKPLSASWRKGLGGLVLFEASPCGGGLEGAFL